MKDIPNYEGLYAATKDGQIWSHPKTKTGGHSGKWLGGGTDAKGYANITLTKNGKCKTHRLHKLIAIAFIPNPDNKKTLNHKNGIKNDNRVENLEWCTQKENIHHAWKTGLCKNHILAGNKTSTNPRSKAIQCIESGTIYYSMQEAHRQTKINRAHLWRSCNNPLKAAGKHPITGERLTWRYI